MNSPHGLLSTRLARVLLASLLVLSLTAAVPPFRAVTLRTLGGLLVVSDPIAARSSRYWKKRGFASGAVSASAVAVRSPASAWARMFRPSAYAAISPYSMPLWTIFTKWPAPCGPQCR